MADKEKRGFQFKVEKLDAEAGTFEGWLSVYDEVDAGFDVVEKGAFTKTIDENAGKVPLLWHHDTKEPVGTLELEDKDEGLWVKGSLVLDVQRAKEGYLMLKAGVFRGLSIGYEAVKKQTVKGIRHLKEIRLYEGSLVVFPMNASANVQTVKSGEEKDDFNTELERVEAFQKRTNMMYALWESLDSIVWYDELSVEEKLTAVDETIQQFSSAYLEFLPTLFALWGEKVDVSSIELPETSREIAEKLYAELGALLDKAVDTESGAGDTSTEVVTTPTEDAVDTSEKDTIDELSRVRDRLKEGLVS